MQDTLQISIEKTSVSRVSTLDYNNIQFAREYSDHMLIADYKDGEWKDIRIVPWKSVV